MVGSSSLGVWDISNYDFTVNPPDGAKIGSAPTARGTYGSFVIGPDSPPAGCGSFFQHVGERSDPPSGDDAARLRTARYDGTLLTDITSLSYWTYVSDFGSGGQATYFQLRVDWDNNGSTDDILYFEPAYQTGGYGMITGPPVPNQGQPVLNTWQYWNTVIGGWWSNVESDGGPPLIRLSDYAVEHPGVRLQHDPRRCGDRVSSMPRVVLRRRRLVARLQAPTHQRRDRRHQDDHGQTEYPDRAADP